MPSRRFSYVQNFYDFTKEHDGHFADSRTDPLNNQLMLQGYSSSAGSVRKLERFWNLHMTKFTTPIPFPSLGSTVIPRGNENLDIQAVFKFTWKMTDLIKEVLRGWDVYGPHSITLEHTLFRIHTQFTAGALFVAGIFIGASQYFGKPISCQLEGVDEEFINAHCWARGIVILRNKRQFDAFEYAPHFGILDYDPRIHEKVFYKNYCHIPWMFVASSAMFALPGLVWHAKKVNWLVKLLQQYSDPCQEDKELEKRLSSLSKVYHNLNPFFGRLAKRFIFCEICVFCNVICHLVLSIVLLKSTFGRYHIGLLEALLSDSKLDRLEYPWDLVFPKYGICQFRNYGSSGDIQTYKPLCMLSQNFATEKIAKPLIVWFLVLTIITLISMVYRVVLISFQGARLTSLMGLAGLSNVNKNLHMVCFSGNYGHWYLLNILSNNIDALTFQDFVSHLAATHAQRPSAP